MSETREIVISEILIPEIRLNSLLDDEQRTFLAASLKDVGLLNDPIVRLLDDGQYELVAGKSRIQELEKIGVDRVSCKVLRVDRKTSLKMNVIENVARGSWDYISMAQTIRELFLEKTSMDEVCKTFNRSPTWIRRTLELLELPEKYQIAVKEAKLTPSHIQLALQMPTPEEVDDALQTTLKLGWNTSILKTYVTNRLYEINAAKELAAAQGRVPEIPVSQPQTLINYKQCLACNYRYKAEDVRIIQICNQCLRLIEYVTAQVGEPSKAIDIVFEALKAHYEAPRTPGPPSPPSSSVVASEAN